ncbi:hypothetical protein DPMN_176082 [Dreissena polymorpha]|uniref:Uncharacterized protein n=1 Tax=Dreissena polymorpha TaxID=45954 RepID=A0A9D4IIU8_DREPO|nr:hypothetical protein DPMN_176082 [Dreissena polymorpha]
MKTVTSTVDTNKLLTDTRTHAHTHIRTPDNTRSHKLTMSLRDRCIFELIQNFIRTKFVVTKFHKDQIINVASLVLTRQMLTTHDRQKAITKAHHEHIESKQHYQPRLYNSSPSIQTELPQKLSR